MIQNIITFLIVSFVVFITIKRLVNQMKNPSKGCDGCSQGCGGCSLEDLKKEIAEKNKSGK
jgi:large-conductance mechanosensitive channel